MMLQCINGVGSNPRQGKNKNLTALKSNSNTVWINFQTYIYLLQYNTKKQNNRVSLVITYSKALPNIHEILKKNMNVLYNSEKMI